MASLPSDLGEIIQERSLGWEDQLNILIGPEWTNNPVTRLGFEPTRPQPYQPALFPHRPRDSSGIRTHAAAALPTCAFPTVNAILKPSCLRLKSMWFRLNGFESHSWQQSTPQPSILVAGRQQRACDTRR